MNGYKIIKSTTKQISYIDNAIDQYNAQQLPFTQDQQVIPLNFHIKSEDGKIIAGINAVMYCWKVVYIDVLFVDANYRKQGLGSLLVKHIEQIAVQEGVIFIHLDTFDWQAKDFYLKQGYDVFGVLDGYPEGHERYYMKKRVIKSRG